MKRNFVDIHTHILPGVDDGATDWEQAKRMLLLQAQEGVTDIIATPHFDREENRQNPDQIRRLVEELNQYAEQAAPGVRIYPGEEVLYTPGILECYRNGEILTMADSRYLLLEFFPRSSYSEIERAVREFVEEGVIPVIAHVERYHHLMEEYDYLYELIKMGATLQMNSRSLLGNYFDKRRRICRKMAKNGFIHFLGSDCHNEEERPPSMKKSFEVLTSVCGEKEACRMVYENAHCIIEKKYL